MIDLAIYFIYKTAMKLKGKDFALITLLLCVMCPFNYIFIFWVYTNTFSWVFIIASIYLVLLMKERRSIDTKFIIYAIIFGLISLIGFLIRATMIIPITAIFITFIIYLILHKKSIILFVKKNYIKLIVLAILILISLGTSYKIINTQINKYYPDSSNNFPVTHWIMMGMDGTGAYNRKYSDYTYSFKTKEDKIKANITKIQEMVNGYGFTGLINHFIKKIPATFTGNYYFELEKIQKPSKLFPYLVDDKKDGIIIYLEAFRIVLYSLVLISLFSQLMSKKVDYRILFTITLFGVILFYTIWESKPTYSLPFISIMIILATSSLKNISSKIEKFTIKHKEFGKTLGLISIIMTIIIFLSLCQGITGKDKIYNKYQLKADFDRVVYKINDVAKDDKIIKQEFYAYGKFNKIGVKANAINKKDIKYKIKLYTKNRIIKTFEVSAKDINPYTNLIYLSLKEQNINKKQKYFITIESDNNKDSIVWGYGLSHTNSQYEGDSYINNKEYKGDLGIVVSYEYYGSFVSKTQYILLMIFTLLIEILIIKNLFNIKK